MKEFLALQDVVATSSVGEVLKVRRDMTIRMTLSLEVKAACQFDQGKNSSQRHRLVTHSGGMRVKIFFRTQYGLRIDE